MEGCKMMPIEFLDRVLGQKMIPQAKLIVIAVYVLAGGKVGCWTPPMTSYELSEHATSQRDLFGAYCHGCDGKG